MGLFVEDRAGACDLTSAGTFKQQHDTGKNLIYVHVFPKLASRGVLPEISSSAVVDEMQSSLAFEASILSLSDFKELILRRSVSWTSKDRLLKALRQLADKVRKANNDRIARDYKADLLTHWKGYSLTQLTLI